MCCTVQKCCCCIDLRTGTIVIACLSLLGSAGALSLSVWLAFVTKEAVNIIESDTEQPEESRDVSLLFVKAFFWAMLIVAVVSGLAVILDIMLLAGAINARRKLLLAWLIGYGIIYCTFLLLLGLLIVGMLFTSTSFGVIKIAVSTIIHAAVMIYYWVVVRSYHQELGHQYGEGPPPVMGRSTAGKVYSTVPAVTAPPTHGAYGYADGIPMSAAAPPKYISSA